MNFHSIHEKLRRYINEISRPIGTKTNSSKPSAKSVLEQELKVITMINDGDTENTSKLKLELKTRVKTILDSACNLEDEADYGREEMVARLKDKYKDRYNEQEYKKILIYCKLAHAFEGGGSPYEHALKLSVLFENFNTAIKSVSDFAQQDQKGGDQKKQSDDQFVHNACLFTLPDNPPEQELWATLKKLARTNGNFSDATFSKIMANANEVKNHYENDAGIAVFLDDIQVSSFKQELGSGLQLTEVKTKIKNIRKNISTLKAQIPSSERNKSIAENNSNLDITLRFYASLCKQQHKKVQDLDKDALNGIYRDYALSVSPARRYLVSQGLNQQSINTFFSLDKSQSGKEIPDIYIESDNYPQYYMRKLDTAGDEIDAVKAACLGKLTDCCQSIGDYGNGCAIHGLTSPNGGFYVLCKKKSAEARPDHANDQIVAQSWAWRSTDDGMVLDSVEHKRANKQMLVDFYYKLGAELSKEHRSDNNFKIPAIYIGTSGNTPKGLGFANCVVTGTPRDYNGYRDSKMQRTLINKDAPYLEQADGLTNDQRMQKTKDILSTKLDDTEVENLSNDRFVQDLIKYLMYNQDKIKDFSGLVTGEGEQEFTYYIDLNQAYFAQLQLYTPDPDRLIRLLELGACRQLRNYSGKTALHYIASHPEKLKTALNLCPKSELLAAIKDECNQGYTVLQAAASHPESLKAILMLLPVSERLAFLKGENENYDCALDEAARNPESLKAILELLPVSERLVTIQKYEGLHTAANHPEALKAILDLLPVSERVAAVKEKVSSLLIKADSHPESLKAILELVPDDQRLTAMKERYRGENVLTRTKGHPELLKAIIELLPMSDRLAALKKRNYQGNTILMMTAKNHPKSLKTIIELLPVNERLAAVKVNKTRPYGSSPLLMIAASNPESLQATLELYPEGERLIAIKEKDYHGYTMLNNTNSNPELLKAILELLPISERLETVEESVKFGTPVLYEAASSPELLKAILELLPKAERLDAIKASKNYSCTILTQCAKSPGLIKAVLELLPKDEHLVAVKETLHWAISNPELLKDILELLPSSERLAAVNVKNKDGDTVLSEVTKTPELLKDVLALLPHGERLDAVKERNLSGYSTLNTALRNYKSLKAILKIYPKDGRLDAVKKEGLGGRTALHMVASSLESLKTILELYPKDERLAAVKEKSSSGQTVLHKAASSHESLKALLGLLRFADLQEIVGDAAVHGEQIAQAAQIELNKRNEAPSSPVLTAYAAKDTTVASGANLPQSLQIEKQHYDNMVQKV